MSEECRRHHFQFDIHGRVQARDIFVADGYTGDFGLGTGRGSLRLKVVRELDREEACDLLAAVQRRLVYLDFLDSERWQELREETILAAGNKCMFCNAPEPAEVHHRTYARFGGNETSGDLVALCGDCHSVFHKQRSLHQGTV